MAISHCEVGPSPPSIGLADAACRLPHAAESAAKATSPAALEGTCAAVAAGQLHPDCLKEKLGFARTSDSC